MTALRLGTRSSALALAQSRHVASCLEALGHSVELVQLITTGDRITDRPLPEIGGKGLFTAELEEGLRDGSLDLAVHSFKDVPVEDDPDLPLGAVLERAPWHDVLVMPVGVTELAQGARVGTSSTRRRAMLRDWRPDLHLVDLRGNVPTRVSRVDDGTVDAAVLAEAGLLRLGLVSRVSVRLPHPQILPAPGQGAVAVQVRAGGRAQEAVAALDHLPTRLATVAEREVLRALGGGCSAPLGALARLDEGHLSLVARYWVTEERDLCAEAEGPVQNEIEARAIGAIVAAKLGEVAR